jgi:xanthine dehydrogenase small subunit
MIQFILNDRIVSTDRAEGTTLLDFIRYERDLPGTKIGCREGDCGACTVLEGHLEGEKLIYRSIVSCLTPLGNAAGRHIVTVEGVNMEILSPVQQLLVDHGGTQCGFCTPGFVMSLTGFGMQSGPASPEDALAAISGNICRCTGYKSIERVAVSISKMLAGKNLSHPVDWLVNQQFLPEYFRDIPQQLASIQQSPAATKNEGRTIMGGGTDLMVQRPEEIAGQALSLLYNKANLKGIKTNKKSCVIGAAATASDIMESPALQLLFPALRDYFKLVSSEPVRNMGTIAGNFVNASPIGDLSIMCLALNATLHLQHFGDTRKRETALDAFFLDYKELDLQKDEYIRQVEVPIPPKEARFNFEKVSKRTHLDIASVNAAMLISVRQGVIQYSRVACGGVAPVPLFLKETSRFLLGKPLQSKVIREASQVLQQEIHPISDVRGSADYKRLLARQLFFAHFLKLFPDQFRASELLS